MFLSLIHFEKVTFQQFPDTIVWGHKFDFAVKKVKGHPKIII